MRTPRSTRAAFRLSPLVAALACAFVAQGAVAATYTVTNTGDNLGVNPLPGDGTGTLRQAIVDANANCGTDASPVIQFIIPTGPFVIATSTQLPGFSCATPYSPTVQGTSQPG